VAQPHLHLEDFERLVIPTISDELSAALTALIRQSEDQFKKAGSDVNLAECLLSESLGLVDTWQPPEPLTYVRRASEVAAAGRFDSEFFAPRTLQLLAKLGAGGRTIRDVAPPRHEEFIAAATLGDFDYIEIGSLRGDGTVASERLACAEAPSRATWRVRAGDVVTSTVRPNRRLSALITPEQTGFVASSGFVVLQPKTVSAEVLLTYLRLPPVCEVMDLHTSASLYPTISETDLLKLPFPQLDQKTCDQVTAAVRAAHAARSEAQALLARAQDAVEVAIEQGEPTALKLLAR
jgi:type I restriction enzyme, S subunit